jgi:hypothetical protein
MHAFAPQAGLEPVRGGRFPSPNTQPQGGESAPGLWEFTQMFFNGVVFTRIIKNESQIFVATIWCASHSRIIHDNLRS